jgi:HSP20 family protein
MSLIRWDPFSDVDTLFGRLVPSNIANWTRLGVEGDGRKLDWAPSADISETDKEYVIRAELPAVKKEDVQVTLDNGMITIKGERKQQKEDKNEKFHRVESFYGTFERRFSLPENVNADSIRCESKEGILTVHIPKPKQITVQ